MSAARPIPMDMTELLGPEGPLAEAIDGFQPRAPQQEMATRIAAFLAGFEDASNPEGSEHPGARATGTSPQLVCEAGTGTGKTFAYLAPILAAGRRAIISTATKPLQAQLTLDDIPRVANALGVHPRVALLKGRANYLCHHRLERALAEPRQSAAMQTELARINTWLPHTRDGDLSTLPDLGENSPVWPAVTSTVDNCLGGSCKHFERCFAARARTEALNAEIVVVNHHLLISDLTLRHDGFGELLPDVDVVMVDEAHALVEVLRRSLGFQLSTRQVMDLARDTRRALKTESSCPDLVDPELGELATRLDALEQTLGRVESGSSRFDPAAAGDPAVAELVGLETVLGQVAARLAEVRDEGAEVANVARRFADLSARQQAFLHQEPDALIRWVERAKSGVILRATPHDIASAFADRQATVAAPWIFTSATLTVAGGFGHFCDTLGLSGAETAAWESPFDYARRAILYLPETPFEPRDAAFPGFVADVAEQIIRLLGGRTFVLFTSHHALNIAAERLRRRVPWPIFIQGQASREQLIREFAQHGQAVLCGAASFWEGVDVRGPALSAVVIDKLPFPRPDDPIRSARAEVLRAEGRDPFREDQLPSAVLSLKQGVGRLIRDETDAGIVAICDPRLRARSYGRSFLKSLPPMPTTTDFEAVRAFWSEIENSVLPDAAGGQV